MSEENESAAEHAIRRAFEARMKHAISEARNLIAVLEKIKNGNAPITEMSGARGCAAKVVQLVNEASAYYSSYQTIRDNAEFIPLSRPAIKKLQPKDRLKRFKANKKARGETA